MYFNNCTHLWKCIIRAVTATLADALAGLAQVAFPATTAPGAVYALSGALSATRSYTYTFPSASLRAGTAASTFSGTALITAADRATNRTTRAFTVTQDATPPQVSLSAPARVTTGTFAITWGATDTQAGVGYYDLDVSVEGGPWQRVLTHTLATSYRQPVTGGQYFTFRVTATDRVSNSASVAARASLVRTTKYYHHGGARVALRAQGVVYYLHGDHLGSVSLITDHASRITAQQRFLPYGGVRWQEGTFPTDFGFTGHRGHPDLGLVFMRARYYHPGLGRFVSADTIVPQPGNPQALNRFAYVLGNPLRYVDPTGHWTEEELEARLGKDWHSNYFGEGAVFEGRDNLLAFLLSEDTTSVAGLELILPFFTLANVAHDLGMEFGNIDALGARVAGSVGVGGFVAVSLDIVLNLAAGECSVFGSPEMGIMIGEGASLVGGLTLLKNLPSNNEFRGTFEAIGFVGGDGIAINAERFWSAPLSDRYEYTDKAHGIFIGGGGSGPAIGVYGSISYSFELYREDAQGHHLLPHRPGALDVACEIGSAIDHDLVRPTVGTIERWLGR